MIPSPLAAGEYREVELFIFEAKEKAGDVFILMAAVLLSSALIAVAYEPPQDLNRRRRILPKAFRSAPMTQ